MVLPSTKLLSASPSSNSVLMLFSLFKKFYCNLLHPLLSLLSPPLVTLIGKKIHTMWCELPNCGFCVNLGWRVSQRTRLNQLASILGYQYTIHTAATVDSSSRSLGNGCVRVTRSVVPWAILSSSSATRIVIHNVTAMQR